MEPVRLGIIGCGIIGRTHARMAAASPLLAPVAVADIREEVAQNVAAEFGVPRAYNSVGDLLADSDVEAVVLALPTAGRVEVALQALSAGKHVLVEKPVGMNADEVRRMIAARGDRVAACCSSRMRGLPSAAAATDFISTGALGALRVVRCRALKGAGEPPTNPPPPWRLRRALNGGGITMNWGCYDLDYLLGITGWSLRPRTALAQMWGVPPAFSAYAAPDSDAETHITALITCDDGIVLHFERAEFVAAATDEAWQILGDRGSLRLHMTPQTGKTLLHDEATPRGVVTHQIWQGDETWGMDHAGVLDDFALAVRGERAPRTSLEHALVVQQITDAMYRSASTGMAVTVE